jgi:leucyl-tRNA synthetase
MEEIKAVSPYTDSPDRLEGEVKALYKKTHATIQRVTRDIEDRFHFNTAISAVMELVNALYAFEAPTDAPECNRVIRFAVESAVLLLSPIVPHFTEEIWEALGNGESILLASWPTYREDALTKDELLIVVQVNGKVRSRFTTTVDADEETLRKMALSDERALKFIADKPVRKVVVVKKKLVNIVV